MPQRLDYFEIHCGFIENDKSEFRRIFLKLDNKIGELVLFSSSYNKDKKNNLGLILSENNHDQNYIIASITTHDHHCEINDYSVVFDCDDLVTGCIHSQSIIHIDKTLFLQETQIHDFGIGKLKKEKLRNVMQTWAKLVTKSYYSSVHLPEKLHEFIPMKSKINYAGRVFDENELLNLVDSSLEFWLTYGKYSRQFENQLSTFLHVKYSMLVNSGSSANLLAFMALTSPLLKDRQIKRGDEIITVAAGFPTTVAPPIQHGIIPVFVDVDLETLNIDTTQLERALSSKTRAVILAHTLGNPFNIYAVKTFCEKYNLWLIEDNCDALGAKYDGQYTGTHGDIGTSSFYPAHHITMGEGGAVYTNNRLLKRIMLSMRDWGKDCWCESGIDNTCGCRFSGTYGTLPSGYDHKYVYSHFGYNLKATDMQAAIGCAQLEKLPDFIKKRKKNFDLLYDGLKQYEDHFILPQATPDSEPAWFGFPITIREDVSFTRNELIKHLESAAIQTRNLFAGNITRHPCFDTLEKDKDFRVIGALKNTDKIANDCFWIGVYPGMTEVVVRFMIEKIQGFVEK